MAAPARPLALVTGAAHRVGRAIALELGRQGYAIGLHYFQARDDAEQTAAAVAAAGTPAYLLPADLSAPPQVDDLFARVARLPHPLRVLVNSAAVMPRGSLRELPVEQWDAVLDLNLRAPWLCARAAARLMESAGSNAGGPNTSDPRDSLSAASLNAGGPNTGDLGDYLRAAGVIVNITDSGAQKAWTDYPAYIISKAALETLTRLLARTLAPGVRVNAVAPGLILPSDDLPPEQWQRLLDRLPLQAAGEPEDVARAVLFFIQNPYITGQVLAVDGGYQLV